MWPLYLIRNDAPPRSSEDARSFLRRVDRVREPIDGLDSFESFWRQARRMYERLAEPARNRTKLSVLDKRAGFVTPAGSPDGGQEFEIRYRLDASASPVSIDLFGFDSGPVAGRTLYGILEFSDDDHFKLDLEAGDSHPDGSRVRPGEFTGDTQVFTREP